jgi:hypothetical protein
MSVLLRSIFGQSKWNKVLEKISTAPEEPLIALGYFSGCIGNSNLSYATLLQVLNQIVTEHLPGGLF